MAEAEVGEGLRRALDEAVAGAVARGDVPQAVVIVAGPDGPLHESVAGPVAVGGDEPVTADHLVRWASMTKPLVAVAALSLRDSGRLDLDTPVERLLPHFAALPVLAGFDGDRPLLRPAATRATVRHLLTHTSGLSYWFWNADLFRWHRATGAPTVLSGRLEALDAPLVADPGTRFEYGVGTDWLGRVLEVVAGAPLDEVLAELVTGPLGMASTTFRPTDRERALLVPVHRRGDDGAWAPSPVDWARDPQWWSGGHGLYGTPRDYLRFQRMLLRGGELAGVRVLAPASVAEMFRDQVAPLPVPRRFVTAHPASSADYAVGPGHGWGHGLLVTRAGRPGRRAGGSGGWAGICNTWFWVDQASAVTVAVHTQALPFCDPGPVRLCEAVELAVYRGHRGGRPSHRRP